MSACFFDSHQQYNNWNWFCAPLLVCHSLRNGSVLCAPRWLSKVETCSGTSVCSVASLNGTQTCQSATTTLSLVVSASSITASYLTLRANADVPAAMDTQQCYTVSPTDTCTWDDAACRCVWTQQQMLGQYEYRRQRCNYRLGILRSAWLIERWIVLLRGRIMDAGPLVRMLMRVGIWMGSLVLETFLCGIEWRLVWIVTGGCCDEFYTRSSKFLQVF